MIPQPIHPWLPQKMVWGGLPLVEELILLVPDAPFAAKELDAVLEDQLPTACYSGQDFACFLHAMLELLPSMLKLRHLLLDLLSSLMLIMQLFF